MLKPRVALVGLLIGGVSGYAQAAQPSRVEVVSPRGRAATVAAVEGRCPTFSWSQSALASGYELLVFEVNEPGGGPADDPVLRVDIPGGATTWVASGADCLETGHRYAWAIRAFVDGTEESVSDVSLFEITAAPSRAEVREALDVLRRFALAADEDPDELGSDGSSGPPVRPPRSSPARAPSSSPSPRTVGVAQASSAGTSTLGLAGSTRISENGIDRASASGQTFDIENSGVGKMTLMVDGSPVITAATQGRLFYQTQDTFFPTGALTACAAGFHMASMWELYNVGMRYATTEPGALTNPDGGQGPPFGPFGWVRTGTDSSTSSSPGIGNCSLWTSNSGGANGSTAALQTSWSSAAAVASPWLAGTLLCSFAQRVWCVED